MIEHRYLARSGMKMFCQRQQPAAIPAPYIREHDGDAGHEKARSHSRPSPGIEVTRHAELDEPLFVLTIDSRWKMAIGRGIGPLNFEHSQACPDRLRQRSKCLEIAALPAAKTR